MNKEYEDFSSCIRVGCMYIDGSIVNDNAKRKQIVGKLVSFIAFKLLRFDKDTSFTKEGRTTFMRLDNKKKKKKNVFDVRFLFCVRPPPFSFSSFPCPSLTFFRSECTPMTKLIRPCLRPIFRKCFHTAYYFLDYPPRNVPTLQEWENSEQDGERTAVAIQKFVQHVASLHADGDIGFSKEYEFIQSESGKFTAENSQYVENKAKNRYLNILACE